MNLLTKRGRTADQAEKPAKTAFKAASRPAAGKRSRLELEFLPEYLEILERPPSSAARGFSLAIVLLCIGVVLWAVYGRIDIIATASGRLIVDDRSKVVQAPERGEVSLILVRDGQEVSAGEVLIELNPTSAVAERARLRRQLQASELETARLEALLSGGPLTEFLVPDGTPPELAEIAQSRLQAEADSTEAQLTVLQNRVEQVRLRRQATAAIAAETQALIKNTQERLDSRRTLMEQGLFPRYQFLELSRELIGQRREQAETEVSLTQLTSEENDLNQQIEQFGYETRKSLLDRLAQEQIQLSNLRNQLIQADENARKMTVTAPVSGVAQQVAVTTVGAVVQPAQELLVVVPHAANLEAEVMVLNKDIGFVRTGHTVEVKVDSFPYTRFGTIAGEVKNVSGDAIEDERLGPVYPARVLLERLEITSGSERIALSPGMTVSAEIRTGDRRIIDYVLSPLREYQSETLRER
ncbi:HlyD family type I secretion periplasmic adaptor subunit (plasmid) [Leisingera sp. S132]|uniref:HlyD family type I secretion periplasmic adaptor subunit n=1 Tax=Leisingera sp. S132 TaxID=2867016 RepID=UPI0021A4CD09|nr:HlyD family type I secretion periplasmic adaptor subunit [Leisingera sp. S132]UWQ81697.1 HlyD family type I secretion periplasmic adaptor subunit [Leisingera sp. S132]